MTQVVVFGMHRTGTSLTMALCKSLGVWPGARLLMKGVRGGDAHYEDWDFLKLNEDILARAGGNWREPPPHRAIVGTRDYFDLRIRRLVRGKNTRDLWGWKDPRTSLTAELYAPHLDDARYVWCRRQEDGVVKSLTERDGEGNWRALRIRYLEDIAMFLHGREHLVMWYEETVSARAQERVEALNEYVGGNGRIEKAVSLIRRRDEDSGSQ